VRRSCGVYASLSLWERAGVRVFAMSEPKNDLHPRPRRLQFSLRLLLLALTAFAIGFPIWYRWPYQEVTEQRDPATGKLWSTRTITWQRQWGGDRLAHGPETMVIADGRTITDHNVQGKRHGPHTVRDPRGRMRVDGQYVNGLKDGRWVEESKWTSKTGSGAFITITSWSHGLLDGECKFPCGRFEDRVAIFKAGRLVTFNGKALDDATFDVLKTRGMDEHTSAELTKETQVDFVEQPLIDVAMYISELHKIPVVVDLRGGFPVDMPITGTYRGLDLQSALVLILATHGLSYDYRYGALWITKPEGIRDLHDPTGVDQVKPRAGSALARAWNEPLAVDCAAPLAVVLAFLEQKMAVTIDASRVATIGTQPAIAPRVSPFMARPSPTIRELPLKHAIGQLLYNVGCRCRLEGDTLVILPAEEMAD
jgi:hypothetical protein